MENHLFSHQQGSVGTAQIQRLRNNKNISPDVNYNIINEVLITQINNMTNNWNILVLIFSLKPEHTEGMILRKVLMPLSSWYWLYIVWNSLRT